VPFLLSFALSLSLSLSLSHSFLQQQQQKTPPLSQGCNQAAAAARLGHATSMIGRVGDDAAGRSLLAALEGAGVETSGVVVCSSTATTTATASEKGEKQTPPPPTGTAVIMLQPDGENSIVIVGGANVEGWGQALLGDRGGERGGGGGSDNASSAAISVSPGFGALLLQREVPEAVNAAYARAAVASGVPVVLGESVGCVWSFRWPFLDFPRPRFPFSTSHRKNKNPVLFHGQKQTPAASTRPSPRSSSGASTR